jgi:succinyl-CoA synthetase alpha subunit
MKPEFLDRLTAQAFQPVIDDSMPSLLSPSHLVPLKQRELSEKIEKSFETGTEATCYRLIDTQHEPFDMNFTTYDHGPGGAFIVCNGYGLGVNTIDLMRQSGMHNIRGFVDLKHHFSRAKFLEAFKMALVECPDLQHLVVNIVSGTAQGGALGAALVAFNNWANESNLNAPEVFVRFFGPGKEAFDESVSELITAGKIISVENTSSMLKSLVRHCSSNTLTQEEIHTPPIETLVRDSLAKRQQQVTENASLPYELDSQLSFRSLLKSEGQVQIGVIGLGATAQFHLRMVEDLRRDQNFGPKIAWAVRPATKTEETTWGFPIHDNVSSVLSTSEQPVDVIINYAPARVFDTVMKELILSLSKMSAETRPKLVLSAAENVPAEIASKHLEQLQNLGVKHLGPNSPGLMILNEKSNGDTVISKIGNLHPIMFPKYGSISVIGRSGTLVFDCICSANAENLGIRFAGCLGGDKNMGLDYKDHLIMLEQDPDTKCIILSGEAGGVKELEIIELIEKGALSKPIIAIIAGKSMPSGVKAGHAGAIDRLGFEDPYLKEELLRNAGVICVNSASEAIVAAKLAMKAWEASGLTVQANWQRLVHKYPNLNSFPNAATNYKHLAAALDTRALASAEKRINGEIELYYILQSMERLGTEIFLSGALSDPNDRTSLSRAFRRHPHYASVMLQGAAATGGSGFLNSLITDVTGPRAFRGALDSTAWAAADLVNEVAAFGTERFIEICQRSIGLAQFKEAFTKRPWNTAHAVRTIGNMDPRLFVEAYKTYSQQIVYEESIVKAGFIKNPWAIARLLRGVLLLPSGVLQEVTTSEAVRRLHNYLLEKHPYRLLEAGKIVNRRLRPNTQRQEFVEALIEQIHISAADAYRFEAMSPAEQLDDITTTLRETNIDASTILIQDIFTPEGFASARKTQSSSLIEGLRHCSQKGVTGQANLLAVVNAWEKHQEKLGGDDFRLGIARNPWMMIELLDILEKFNVTELEILINQLITKPVWDHCLKEHQWGLGAGMRKMLALGTDTAIGVYNELCAIEGWQQSFARGFSENPRDTVQILQVAKNQGTFGFLSLVNNHNLGPSFYQAMCLSPRNLARILEALSTRAQETLNEFPNLAEDIKTKAPILLRQLKFGRDLR